MLIAAEVALGPPLAWPATSESLVITWVMTIASFVGTIVVVHEDFSYSCVRVGSLNVK